MAEEEGEGEGEEDEVGYRGDSRATSLRRTVRTFPLYRRFYGVCYTHYNIPDHSPLHSCPDTTNTPANPDSILFLSTMTKSEEEMGLRTPTESPQKTLPVSDSNPS